MTGYGRARLRRGGRTAAVELAAVNHRFLKIQLRLPDLLLALRPRLEEILRREIRRGAVTGTAALERPPAARPALFHEELARRYLRTLARFARREGLSPPRDVSLLVHLPGVFEPETTVPALTPGEEELVLAAMERATAGLARDRRREGRALVRDLRDRHRRLLRELRAVARHTPAAAAAYRARLEKRMQELLGEAGVDRETVLREVAVFAERGDVTEELTRLRSHLDHLGRLLGRGGECGKALEFLLQEIQREVNTLGTKAPSPQLSPHVLAMKAEVEKIREQAQNLE